MKKLLLLFYVTLFFNLINAQIATYPNGMPVHRNCGTIPPDDTWEAQFQQQIQNFINLSKAAKVNESNSTVTSSYTIPVVVHVIHGGQAVGTYPNISNAQALSQISILTNDFAGIGKYTNHYPSDAFNQYASAAGLTAPSYDGAKITIANAQITFIPTYYDNNGNTMPEPGIDRVNFNTFTLTTGYTSKDPANSAYNTTTTFHDFIDNIVKVQTIWPTDKFMNIWVTDHNSAVGLLGFANFPGGTGLDGLPGPYGSSTNDGIWCWAKSYGAGGAALAPYNLGRTVTHEVGHWLGLRHIWGDASCATDYCLDTPPVSSANYVNQNNIAVPPTGSDANTVTYPYLPNNCASPSGSLNTTPTGTTGVMFMNFMDYSDDNAMCMFTSEQVTRIQTVMTTTRSTLGTHGLTIAPPTASFTSSSWLACVNQPISFTDYSASGDGGAPTAWSYTATGASVSTSTMQNPIFTFTALGTQTITLIATANGTQVSLPYTHTIGIGTSPSVSITASSSSICAGNSATLTASGASSYTWSTSQTSSSISINPLVQTTYTVAGSSLGTCISTKTAQIFVNPVPTIYANTNGIVCKGTSASIIASGATTYSWSNGATTDNINVLTLANVIYTVTGTDLNNCSSTQTVEVVVDNTCADVWPGDANSDGITDNIDFLELGSHIAQTGPARAIIDNSWQSFHADNWLGTISNGENLNHSDCNGDGIINADDTVAIYNNYGLTHAFKQSNEQLVNPQLNIVPDQSSVVKGAWGTASIYLGDASLNVNNLNGVAFTIDFDNTVIEPNSIWIEYINSFINTGDNLHFRKLDFASGKIYTATTHTLSNNVNGNGKIAVLHYQIKSDLVNDVVLNLGISDVNQSDASGNITPLTAGTTTIMALANSVGVKDVLGSETITVHPNPSSGIINIKSTTALQKVELLTVTGQVVMSEPIINSNTHIVDMSRLSNGVYFLNLYRDNKVIARQRVVLNK